MSLSCREGVQNEGRSCTFQGEDSFSQGFHDGDEGQLVRDVEEMLFGGLACNRLDFLHKCFRA